MRMHCTLLMRLADIGPGLHMQAKQSKKDVAPGDDSLADSDAASSRLSGNRVRHYACMCIVVVA